MVPLRFYDTYNIARNLDVLVTFLRGAPIRAGTDERCFYWNTWGQMVLEGNHTRVTIQSARRTPGDHGMLDPATHVVVTLQMPRSRVFDVKGSC